MDALDLVAKIKMDLAEYEEGLDKAKSSAEKAGGGIGGVFSKVASVGGKALVGLTKATAVAVGAAATGVGVLVKKSIEAYGEYEQLAGGIQKLYGNMGMSLDAYAESIGKTAEEAREEWTSLENTQNMVLENANNAWKTTGLNANQYINGITGFSAALINSTGKNMQEAAKLADMAMQDIADNANTFGKYTVEELTGVYQALAKGQFQTLDNLNLGYGGTKEGMQSLIDKANELAVAHGEAGDLVIDSYADIVKAIHLVQEDMNITGTTAREASKTIEGSLNQLKAAWGNLLTGLGDKNADLGQLMKNVVDSIVGYTDEAGNHINGFIDNIIPVIENALNSIGTLIQELVPKALELLPPIISSVLPSLVQAGTDLIKGMIVAINSNLPTLTTMFANGVGELVDIFASTIPMIINVAGSIIEAILSGIEQNADALAQGAVNIIQTFSETIITLLPTLMRVGLTLIESLAESIAGAIPELIPTIVDVISQIAVMIVDHLPLLLKAGMDIVLALAEGLIEAIPDIIAVLPTLIQSFIDGLVSFLPQMTEAWVQLMDCLSLALPEIVDAILDVLPQIMDTLVNYWIGDGAQQTFMASVIMFGSLTKALLQIAAQVIASIGMFVRNIGSTIASEAGNMTASATTMFTGLLNGANAILNNVISRVKSAIQNIIAQVKGVVSQFYSAGANMITGLYNGIKDKMAWVIDLAGSLATSLINKVKNTFKERSPSKVFYEIGDYLGVGLGMGWEDSMEEVNKQIDKDLHYKGEIDMTAKTGVSGVGTVAGTNGTSLTDSDIEKILSGLSINLYNTTEIDGQAIKKDSYKYTVTRLGDETRAVKVSMGGF